jgi:hypothetical protein
MSRNNRIFYATQAIALRPQNADGTSLLPSNIAGSGWYFPRGVQSAGITTNFTLEQVFQLGQIELYDNIEDVPEVEVTINKVIDGTPPLYLMCMGGPSGISGANGKELPALANNRVNFRLGIFPDSNSAATGTPSTHVDCSGMYLSSVSYTIPVDGNATEDVTLVGNNKYWGKTNLGAPGSFFATSGVMTAPAIGRRYKYNSSSSVIPTGTDNGSIPVPAGGRTSPYLQNITISADLGREAINELGSMAPYFRYVNFPVEVTSEFEIIADQGDKVEAKDFSDLANSCGTVYKNLSDKTIKVVICGSGGTDNTLTIDLGNKNKLTSVNYTGGEAGGDNATVSYSYQTFNKLVVTGGGDFIADKWVDLTDDAAIVGD